MKLTVSQWGDPVFADDDFYETIEDCLECFEDNGEEPPEYIWGAKGKPIIQVDLDSIMDHFLEDAYEEWEWDGSGKEEFELAIEKFNAANNNLNNTVWTPDYSIAIVIDPEDE